MSWLPFFWNPLQATFFCGILGCQEKHRNNSDGIKWESKPHPSFAGFAATWDSSPLEPWKLATLLGTNIAPRWDMGVSKNRATPKWMVYNGKPYQNIWLGGTTIFGNIHMLILPWRVPYFPSSEGRGGNPGKSPWTSQRVPGCRASLRWGISDIVQHTEWFWGVAKPCNSVYTGIPSIHWLFWRETVFNLHKSEFPVFRHGLASAWCTETTNVLDPRR